MAKFDLNQILSEKSKAAAVRPKPTNEIRRIPLDQLVSSEKNKYSIERIEELAANIEMVGLLQSPVVRELPGGRYEIISGHRRYHACKMLHDGGNEEYVTVPCMVEVDKGDAFAELQLLSANAMARELSDYEKTYQAGRIKDILLQMKADGYKFEGRMRDAIAQMLDVSSSQVAIMESINEHLTSELTEQFKAGGITITTAYELSRAPEDAQAEAAQEIKSTGTMDTKRAKEKQRQAKASAPASEPSPEAQPTEAQPEPVRRIIDRQETVQRLCDIAANAECTIAGLNVATVCRDAAELLEAE